jgi:hypothetical protein
MVISTTPSIDSFCKYHIFYPEELTHARDHTISIAFWNLTLGLLRFFCYLALYDLAILNF